MNLTKENVVHFNILSEKEEKNKQNTVNSAEDDYTTKKSNYHDLSSFSTRNS